MNINIDAETRTPDLINNRPQYSATAGYKSNVNIDAETPVTELFNNRPNYSATAGYVSGVNIDAETQIMDLHDNRPHYSATAGYVSGVNIDAETQVMVLETKLGTTPINVLNPGAEDGYKHLVEGKLLEDEFIRENRPSYSYAVNKDYEYKERNSETHQPHFHEKLQTDKSYGQLSQSGGFIPRAGIGIEQPRTSLSEGRKFKKNKYAPNQKKTTYRI